MTNKVEFAEIVVPMYRCSTDCKTYQYRASIGPRTDVPILVANTNKKSNNNIYIGRGSARAGERVCAYNNTTNRQKQIYFHDAKN